MARKRKDGTYVRPFEQKNLALFSQPLPLGHQHQLIIIDGYVHPDNTIKDYPPDVNDHPYDGMVNNIQYRIKCTKCMTTKFMYHKNIFVCTSCGCLEAKKRKNFGWDGQSKHFINNEEN